MSNMQRTKGAAAEREFCGLIHANLGIKVARNLTQTRSGGGDICLMHMLIEVKHQKVPKIGTWWMQAVKSAQEANKMPVLAYKIDRKPWRVIMPSREAWATPHTWRNYLEFTDEKFLPGFWLYCREQK